MCQEWRPPFLAAPGVRRNLSVPVECLPFIFKSVILNYIELVYYRDTLNKETFFKYFSSLHSSADRNYAQMLKVNQRKRFDFLPELNRPLIYYCMLCDCHSVNVWLLDMILFSSVMAVIGNDNKIFSFCFFQVIIIVETVMLYFLQQCCIKFM